jgi:GT2 family glycosyltransferase
MPKVVTLDFAPGDKPEILSIAASQPPAGTIGIPVRDHLNAQTAIALLTTVMSPNFGLAGTVNVEIVQGSILTTQRNLIVQRLQGDWLLFLDDDMVWQPDQIRALLALREEHDLDMLGALCFRRAYPYEPTLYMREAPDEGGYLILEDWKPDEIVEVDATGLAFCVIHRRVFERIVAKANGLDHWEFPEDRGGPPPDFFRWQSYLGEDLRFCQDAKAAGSRIWVATGIEVGHVAEVTIDHRDFWRSLAERPMEVAIAKHEMNEAHGLPTVLPAVARRRLRGQR